MTMTPRGLEGRCALVTGSSRGLGLSIARALAAAGCHVVLNGLEAAADTAAIRADIEAQHGVRTLYSAADLRSRDQIAQLVATADAAFGAVDILVNNAVVRHTAPVDAFAPEQWDDALAVNLSAAFHTIRLTLPGMRQRQWGRIINVSSIYGLRGATNRVGYVTTKTALLGLTRAVALETAGQGVTCNAICPGTTETPIHEAAIEDLMAARGLGRADAERQFFTGRQPTGRFIAAAGVAALVVFLCGNMAADITGASLPVDGGWAIA